MARRRKQSRSNKTSQRSRPRHSLLRLRSARSELPTCWYTSELANGANDQLEWIGFAKKSRAASLKGRSPQHLVIMSRNEDSRCVIALFDQFLRYLEPRQSHELNVHQ